MNPTRGERWMRVCGISSVRRPKIESTTGLYGACPSMSRRSARIPIVIESRGGFGELIAFIQKLEQLPAAVWVDDLHISAPAQKAGQEGELNCELTLAVFADNRDNSG